MENVCIDNIIHCGKYPLTLQQPSYLIGIFSHLKLCLADAIHNFKWAKIIQIWKKIDVNDFEILLFDVTFYPKHVQKLVFNALIKTNISGTVVKALNLEICYASFLIEA